MFIIVEGIDGSGKSTLVSQLQQHGAVLLRGENQYDRASIEKFLAAIKKLYTSNVMYVCDRSFISDLVYRFIDKENAAAYTLEHLYLFCKYCSVLVYCNSRNAYENSMRRGETNIVSKTTSDELRLHYDFLIDIIQRYNLINVVQYDYDSMTVNDVINLIKEVKK